MPRTWSLITFFSTKLSAIGWPKSTTPLHSTPRLCIYCLYFTGFFGPCSVSRAYMLSSCIHLSRAIRLAFWCRHGNLSYPANQVFYCGPCMRPAACLVADYCRQPLPAYLSTSDIMKYTYFEKSPEKSFEKSFFSLKAHLYAYPTNVGLTYF
jgi:hypothetical protein